MIELIRAAAVPASIMRAASRGALSLPAAEMVEILVYLTGNPAFGEQAELTLSGWDEASAKTIAGDPNTPSSVLDYMSNPRNLRPVLLSALLENPSVSDERLAELIAKASMTDIDALMSSGRVKSSNAALEALAKNHNLNERQVAEVRSLSALVQQTAADLGEPALEDVDVFSYMTEHAEEIKAAEGQSFNLFGWTAEEQAEVEQVFSAPASSTAAAKTLGVAAKAKPARESTIQKVARLSVGERVQLALKGNKEERFVLIRDGVKVVCNAVIDAPKVSEAEVEMFASMKNVNESVLRAIASKRKFIKSYSVIRILTSNPRCPIDVSVPLLSHLLTLDLKNLSLNKNVAETVRKMATKMFRDRLTRNR
jgi:hypothetical protein